VRKRNVQLPEKNQLKGRKGRREYSYPGKKKERGDSSYRRSSAKPDEKGNEREDEQRGIFISLPGGKEKGKGGN